MMEHVVVFFVFLKLLLNSTAIKWCVAKRCKITCSHPRLCTVISSVANQPIFIHFQNKFSFSALIGLTFYYVLNELCSFCKT